MIPAVVMAAALCPAGEVTTYRRAADGVRVFAVNTANPRGPGDTHDFAVMVHADGVGVCWSWWGVWPNWCGGPAWYWTHRYVFFDRRGVDVGKPKRGVQWRP